MGLFATLAKSDVLAAKAKPVAAKKDPRVSFVKTVNEKIALIDSGDTSDKGHWFKKADGGEYLIWPRGGIAILKFNDQPVELTCANKRAAIDMMKKLVEACKAGEFDDQFEEIAAARGKPTGKARKSPKAKSNGVSAQA